MVALVRCPEAARREGPLLAGSSPSSCPDAGCNRRFIGGSDRQPLRRRIASHCARQLQGSELRVRRCSGHLRTRTD